MAVWVGRLDSKSKLRITWKLAFGPKGRLHEIACTVSRKSMKREVFLDGELIHSGALGLLESVGGVAADTTLFEHEWEFAGRTFCVCERVFVREGAILSTVEVDDPGAASAIRESARFELAVDGELYHTLPDIDSMSTSQKKAMEDSLAKSLAASQDSQSIGNDNVQHAVHVRVASARNCTESSNRVNNATDKLNSAGTGQHQNQKQQQSSRDDAVVESNSVADRTEPNSSLQYRRTYAVGVLTDNGLAARVQCTLGPGILGGKLRLTNDESGTCVLVGSASSEAVKCGIETGDILLSLNGRMLPPKLDAVELMSLLRANPRYMLSEVVACLWRRLVVGVEARYITTYLTGLGRPLLLEIAQIEGDAFSGTARSYQFDRDINCMEHSEPADPKAYVERLHGYYVVMRSSVSHEGMTVRRGDVLVGLDYEPMPRFSTAVSVAQIVGDWAAAGKLCANFWRLDDKPSCEAVIRSAASSKRTVLIASPSEVAAAAATSGAGIWGAATTAVTVTGDGGTAEERIQKEHQLQPALGRNPTEDRDAKFEEESPPERQISGRHLVTPDRPESVASRHDGVVPHKVSQIPERSDAMPSMTAMLSAKTPIADDKNFAVFKRLLQSGATLDEIIAEMRVAGVPKETTQRIIESLRTLVAERAAKVAQPEENPSAKASSVERRVDVQSAVGDPRTAMLAMIAKRQRPIKAEGDLVANVAAPSQSKAASKANSDVDVTLARYRKMVKLGVPAASVRQRMRLDQVEINAVQVFSSENGLETDEQNDTPVSARDKTSSKRAKLHWDAMTLDDSAMAVSVWAADAFGDDVDISPADRRTGASTPGGSGLLGDDDLERLATLFSDAENSSSGKKLDETRRQNGDNGVLTINGRVLTNARIFDPQRSQNVSITIAPLTRAHGGVEALACAIARMDTPRTSLEQLETLLAAMPTAVEKKVVDQHVCAPVAISDLSELARLDAAIAKDPRFSMLSSQMTLLASTTVTNGGKGTTPSADPDMLLTQPGCIADILMHDVIVEREITRKSDSVPLASAEGKRRLRAAFVAENLAPAERFTFAVIRVEEALSKLRSIHPIVHDTKQGISKAHVSLSRRLEALITLLSAQPATEALAGKADSYLHAARSLVASRHLAKLLRHVLAAGNAVNAGSAKAGASAVRLSSLIQAARTKGADGKTSLLDGVVGLLLDRAARKQQWVLPQDQVSVEAMTPPSSRASSPPFSRPSDVRWTDDASPQRRTLASGESVLKDDVFLRDDLLDFPENDGLLASLDAVRGADERALKSEATKFAENLGNVVATEIRHALLELGPDAVDEEDPRIASRLNFSAPHALSSGRSWEVHLDPLLATYLLPHGSSRQRRLAERDRLTQLETDAVLRTQTLLKDHVEPLEMAVNELRTYFACDTNEPLEAIFATLRDFLRAFCESRNAQRRHRRAEKREAERKAARSLERSTRTSVEQIKTSDGDLSTESSIHVPSSALPAHTSKPSQASRTSTLKKQAKPPTYPYVILCLA